MKQLFFSIILAISFVSCSNDFITLNPPSNLNSDGFYKTETDINQAVLSAYGSLRNLYNQQYIRLGEIRSDNTTYSWLSGNPANEKGIDEFASPLLPENGFTTGTWNSSYNTILRCNIVIGRIENVPFKDENLKRQYIAEARFLRALIYFYLNRIFGGVALNGELLGVIKVDKEISQTEAYELLRAPLQEIYDLIIEDLEYAKANLPESYPSTSIGRVTKGGAIGMLGKVYMTMAGYPLNKGNEYYSKAIEQFKLVINDSRFSLEPSYKALFDVANKNTKESLFEVQYKKGAPNGATGSPWNNNFAPRFSDKEVVLVGNKSGENAPTQSMSDAYEYGDPRKFVSMKDGWVNAKTGAWESDKYVCKYYDVSTSGSDNGNNWIELRLADIYLLYAEALVRTNGDKQEAINYVNKIRERARNTPNDPTLTDIPATLLVNYQIENFPTDAALLLAIENERRIELAFENHRWFDLVRTNRAKDVMIASQEYNGYPDFVWTDNALAYPIPMTVMQSNPDKIIQNMGYTQM